MCGSAGKWKQETRKLRREQVRERRWKAALGMLVGLGQNNFPFDRMTFL